MKIKWEILYRKSLGQIFVQKGLVLAGTAEPHHASGVTPFRGADLVSAVHQVLHLKSEIYAHNII